MCSCSCSDDPVSFVGHVFDKARENPSFLLKGEGNTLAFMDGKCSVKVNMVVSSVAGEGTWCRAKVRPRQWRLSILSREKPREDLSGLEDCLYTIPRT